MITLNADRIISLAFDPYRNCFYALTVNNAISVYKPNGDKSIQHLQTLANLYKAAQDKAPGSPYLTPKAFLIISLHVIEPSRAQGGIQLMAFIQNGTRLFFAPAMGYGYAPATTTRPLQLVHVRLPPSNLLHPDIQSPDSKAARAAPPDLSTARPFVVSGLDPVCYSAGLTIAAQPGDTEQQDFLLCISPDITQVGSFQQTTPVTNMYTAGGQTRPPLVEKATMLTVPGRTWALAVAPRSSLTAAADTPADCPAPVLTNDLATQFCEPPRSFIILTNAGVAHMVKRRPLDALLTTIEEYHNEGNAQSLMQFRDRYTENSLDHIHILI